MISEKLDALTDEELRRLAARIGLDLPEDLDRVFVLEEILEAMEEDSPGHRGTASPVHIAEIKYAAFCAESLPHPAQSSDVLPDQYGETMIRALVRDPSWAFAFWDLSVADRLCLKEDEDHGLFLRVAEIGAGEERKRDAFDIPVAAEDRQWYINLPRPGARYRIELCSRAGGKSRCLARATETLVPRQALDPEALNVDEARGELLRLSGLELLDIEPRDSDHPQRLLASDREGE